MGVGGVYSCVYRFKVEWRGVASHGYAWRHTDERSYVTFVRAFGYRCLIVLFVAASASLADDRSSAADSWGEGIGGTCSWNLSAMLERLYPR